MMNDDLFRRFNPPKIVGLPKNILEKMITCTRSAFGCSNWIAGSGAWKPYYFNLDRALGGVDKERASFILDNVATHIQQVIDNPVYQAKLDGQMPVLGYICSHEAPTGIVQTRGALAERLGLPSILIHPDKQVLRSRVVCDGDDTDFPQSVKWLGGRQVLLLSDAATTGESLARSKGVLQAFGASVLAAVVIYDRGEGAIESLEQIEIALYPVYTASIFIELREQNNTDAIIVEKIKTATGRQWVRDFSDVVSLAS